MCINMDGNRCGNTDRIGNLYGCSFTGTCRNKVLGDIACRIGGRTVNLGRIFSRKGTAAVRAASTIGIDNDLASRQSGIPLRTADDKTPCRIDVVGDLIMQHAIGFKYRVNHLLFDCFLHLFKRDIVMVLGRNNDSIDTYRFAVNVLDRDLRLAVRPQKGYSTVLANLRKL